MKKLLLIFVFLASPILVSADEATTTPEVATSTPSTATITIRDGDVTAFTGVVLIPASTTPPIDIAPTNSSSTVSVAADSLLAILVALDASTTDFDITDLAYFSSFGSFIINCISIPTTSSPDCFNWTYAVNGGFPQIGIDDQLLQNGDIVYLFFGPSRQTIVSTTTAAIDEQFTATAQKYDLDSGAYVGVPGVILGVGISNPDFSFTEFATSTTDTNGQAVFTMHATGTFSVGIQEDFYFPSASITITEASATSTEEVPLPPPPSNGGGGGSVHIQLNTATALAYLVSKQHADGSFDSVLLTDWAAFAFAAANADTPKSLLRSYLLSSTPTLSNTTDYERHAMALMALGIDPYSGTSIDYIARITSAFDGTQIGDVHLDNDDVFALFPLLHAGYSASDEIIQKTVAFILSAQNTNGAWDGSVDMTAAAIQALSQVASLPGVGDALTKAEGYLRSQQQNNGGWGNSFSTSWALQAISALNQSPSNWLSSGLSPTDYLSALQQLDGGVESTSADEQTRIWATEYAITGSLGKTWSSLLSSFEKPSNVSSGSGSTGGSVLGTSTSTSATSTATTTPAVATTTPEIVIATSTPIEVTVSTTTSTTPPLLPKQKKTEVKKIVPKIATPTPAITASSTIVQTAAVGEVSKESFIGKFWNAITSFFARLF